MSSSWTFIPETSGEFDSFTARLRKVILLHAVLCLALCVAACGDAMPSHGGPSPPQKNATSSSTSQTTLAPLLAPAGSDERPPLPGSLGRPIAADGLPSLQPSKGVNVSVDTLFSDDIKDPIERSRRLEIAVTEIRRDFDATLPAIKRLVAIEKDIQLLTAQLETLLNGEQPTPDGTNDMSGAPLPLSDEFSDDAAPLSAPPVEAAEPTPPPPAPKPEPAPEKAQAAPDRIPAPIATPVPAPIASAPAAAAPAALAVSGLRLGEHNDKTRLVFDMTGPATFRTDLDNDEKILIVEIEKAAWKGAPAQTFSSPLIQSYTTQPLDGGDGTRIILVLKGKTTLTSESVLSPEPPANNHRLVIDLKHE